MAPTVYIAHCVDAEGPLYESIEATFERLRQIFHIDLEPSKGLLAKLQAGEVPLGGLERAVQKVVDPQLLAYNDTWDKVDTMLNDLLAPSFRNLLLDSEGKGWINNWFCVDHVDYEVNPRRRDVGYHNIFDHYKQILAQSGSTQDGLHFHYHPHTFAKHAHRCSTHWWAHSDSLYQVLSRRIIDRAWFPSVNRPGFHTTRPDSHWFLEQHIPFDIANQAVESSPEEEQQFDLSHGRFGDWRRATNSWTPYHPSHDDYQVPGDCRRWIARCLNVGTRTRALTEMEVRRAFQEAREGMPILMAFTDHDFRDVRQDVNIVRGMLRDIKSEFPDVEFVYCDALTAMRRALELSKAPKCELELSLHSVADKAHVLTVRTDQPTFGPQPYLAIKTIAGTYHHDNFDFQVPHHEWTFVFDEETLPLQAVERVGVATNNSFGVTSIARLNIASGETTLHYLGNTDQGRRDDQI